MKLYYHKTSGGAEYLFDTFIKCKGGHREGVINDKTKYVVRIDGDIRKDAELTVIQFMVRAAMTPPERKDTNANCNYNDRDGAGGASRNANEVDNRPTEPAGAGAV